MSIEARKFRATDARQLLENPMFVEAFEAVGKQLQMAALTCEPDNATKAQRIIITQQLLAAVKREITRVVEDGKIAEIQLSELENRKKFALFRR